MSDSTQSVPPPVGDVVAVAYERFRATLLRTLPFSLLAVLLGQWPSVYLLQGGESLQLLAPKSLDWWFVMLLASVGTLWCWLVIARRQWGRDSLVLDIRAATRVLPRALLILLMSSALVGLGALALVIPGIYLLVALWPALAVSLAEDASARVSIDRALVLVRGAWWQSLSLLLVPQPLRGSDARASARFFRDRCDRGFRLGKLAADVGGDRAVGGFFPAVRDRYWLGAVSGAVRASGFFLGQQLALIFLQ